MAIREADVVRFSRQHERAYTTQASGKQEPRLVDSQKAKMSALGISFMVFACIFGSAMLGCYLRTLLHDHHLSDDSLRVVTLGTSLLATLTAVVLGMLISSARTSFDRASDEITETASTAVLLDRALANYGSETKDARELLHHTIASATDIMFAAEGSAPGKLTASERLGGMEHFQATLRGLAPRNDVQRSLQSRALALSDEVIKLRWLVMEHETNAMLTPFLMVLVLWLSIIFFGIGINTANNLIVLLTLFICALSVSLALFLIEELNHPFDGLMQVSSAPLRNALTQLGQ
jgi:hypothetical protein